MVAHLLFAIHSFSILAFWLFLSVTFATACSFSGDKLSRKNNDDGVQEDFKRGEGSNGKRKSKDISLERKGHKVEKSERLSLHGEDVNVLSVDRSLPSAAPKVPPTETTQQPMIENHSTQHVKSMNLVSCADTVTQKDSNIQNIKATKKTEKLTPTNNVTKTHDEHVPASKERIVVGSKDILMAPQERPKIEKPKRQHSLTRAKPSAENSRRQKESVNQLQTATQEPSLKQDVLNKRSFKRKKSKNTVEVTQENTVQFSADNSKKTTKPQNNTSKTEKEVTSSTRIKTNNSVHSKKTREPNSKQFTQENTQNTQDV